MNNKLVLIGGNPKGFDIPFHPSTKSGKILREMITKIGIHCEIADMTKNRNDIPTDEEIKYLLTKFKGYHVIFLGRFVEKRLKKHFPTGVYLPHPASRRKIDLEKLEAGLNSLIMKPTYMDYRLAYFVLDGSAENGCEIVHTCFTEKSAKKYMEENKPKFHYEVLRRHELGPDYRIVGIRSPRGIKLRIKRTL